MRKPLLDDFAWAGFAAGIASASARRLGVLRTNKKGAVDPEL
jgi:hypothetical protein